MKKIINKYGRFRLNPCLPSAKTNAIVAALTTHTRTLQDVASEFGVSHQWCSFVYKRSTGEAYHFAATEHRRHLSAEARQRHLGDVAFTCMHCMRPVLYGERVGRGFNGYKYCRECQTTYRVKERDLSTIIRCEGCNHAFHPFRGRHSVVFCSIICAKRTRYELDKRCMRKEVEVCGVLHE
jgi:hypothetical protein